MTNQALVALLYWLLFSPPPNSFCLLLTPTFLLFNGCKGGIFWRQQSRLFGKPWTGSWGKREHQVCVSALLRVCHLCHQCVISVHIALILSCWFIGAVRLSWVVNVVVSQGSDQSPYFFYVRLFAHAFLQIWLLPWLYVYVCICVNGINHPHLLLRKGSYCYHCVARMSSDYLLLSSGKT